MLESLVLLHIIIYQIVIKILQKHNRIVTQLLLHAFKLYKGLEYSIHHWSIEYFANNICNAKNSPRLCSNILNNEPDILIRQLCNFSNIMQTVICFI